MSFKIAVIIATYNRIHLLKKQLAALANQSLESSDYEVIIVDDGTKNFDKDSIQQFDVIPEHLTVLQQDHNGPAAARNLGVSKTEAPILAFTDDDCIADYNWLENILKAFKNATTPDDMVGVQGLTYTNREEMTPLTHQIENLEGHPTVPTCNAAYKRVIFKKIGGFDEHFPHPHNEDADLAWRAKEHGTIPFDKHIKMYHPPRKDSLLKNIKQKRKLESEFRLWWKAKERYKQYRNNSPWYTIYVEVFIIHQLYTLKHYFSYWRNPIHVSTGILITFCGWIYLLMLLPDFVKENKKQKQIIDNIAMA